MAKPDPHADGLSLVIELPWPATPEDVARCNAAFSDWLDHYESEDAQSYRNCGCEAEAGSRSFVLWADRIADPAGPEAAHAHATRIARQLEAHWPGSRVRIESADAASNRDLAARVGGTAVQVSSSVMESLRRGELPAASPELVWHGLLEPRMSWIGALFLVRMLLNRLAEAPLLASSFSLLGIVALAWLSRKRTLRSVIVGVIVPLACTLAGLLARDAHLDYSQLTLVLMLEPVALLVWGFAWSRLKSF